MPGRIRLDHVALERPRPALGHLAPARVAGAEKQHLQFPHCRLHNSAQIHRQHLLQPLGVLGHPLAIRQRPPHPGHRLPRRRGRSLAGQGVVHPAPLLPGIHQPGLVEDGQMLGNRGHRQPHQLGNLANAQLARPAAPCSIRSRFSSASAFVMFRTLFILSHFANNRSMPQRSPLSIPLPVFCSWQRGMRTFILWLPAWPHCDI